MCPPNNPRKNFADEENDLFTIDFNSIYEDILFDEPCTNMPLCGSPYNINEEVWFPVEYHTGHVDTSPSTPPSDLCEQGTVRGESKNWHSEANNLSSIEHCGSNSDDKPIEQTNTNFLVGNFCKQEKVSTTMVVLNQKAILDDLVCPKTAENSMPVLSVVSDTQVGTQRFQHNTMSSIRTNRPEDEHDPATDDDDFGGKRRKLVCKVCGDSASGFHYRVASCEACKAFFKRTVQRQIEYACPASGNCKISTRGRKACQACRFVQCIKSGMLKEGVRTDRKRGGRQKYFRRAFSHQPSIFAAQPNGMSIQESTLLQSLKNSPLSTTRGAMSLLKVETMSPPQIWIVLAELFNRYIQDVIGGLNQVVGFADFTLEDKMSILKRSWSEVLTLKFVCSCDDTEKWLLKFAPNFAVNRTKAGECGMEEYFDACQKAKDRVSAVGGVNAEQLLILQALILVNSDDGFENTVEHKQHKDNILSLLTSHSLSSSPSPQSSILYIQNLLLILPCIKEANMIMMGIWKELKGQIDPSNKLLVDMISR